MTMHAGKLDQSILRQDNQLMLILAILQAAREISEISLLPEQTIGEARFWGFSEQAHDFISAFCHFAHRVYYYSYSMSSLTSFGWLL